jgi:hypothetical protein
MHNHYHIVIQLQPELLRDWNDEEIADRWLSLCRGGATDAYELALRKRALLQDSSRMQELRVRLCSLSWFMRFINEPLARMANAEDDCTGRFWEGRFKSQLLLDVQSILACMAYVDLNPVRAGITSKVEDAEHTSLRRRLRRPLHSPLISFGQQKQDLPYASMTLCEYLELVAWTTGGEREAPSIIDETPRQLWLRDYSPRPGAWPRALGSLSSLKDYANRVGQRWVRRSAAKEWDPVPGSFVQILEG